MIKGVFLDLDGTLIKSMHLHYNSWKKILIEEGIKINQKDFFLLEGTKLIKLMKYFLKDFNTFCDCRDSDTQKSMDKIIDFFNSFFTKTFK